MNPTILLVEDNENNLKLMRYLLEARGHQTVAVTGGAEAIEAALELHPALVLLDIHLPDLDGREVLRRLRAHDELAGTRIVAVTALAMVGDRDAFLRQGFDGYVAKPLQPRTFGQEIESYLDNFELVPSAHVESVGVTQRSAPVTPRNRTILVVDNVAANDSLLRACLEPAGFRVVSASSMAEAQASLEAELPDLVISDVHMPHGSGYDLLRALRDNVRTRDVPLVFMSSTSSWEEYGRLQAAGANDVILRPVDPSALVARVEGVLGEPAERGSFGGPCRRPGPGRGQRHEGLR